MGYMFYGNKSAQKSLLETHASNTIIFLKDIDSSEDLLSLDEDIASFTIKDICDAEVDKEAASDTLVTLEKLRSSASTAQCSAWSNYNSDNQHRCSAAALKTSDLCWRHNAIATSGKVV